LLRSKSTADTQFPDGKYTELLMCECGAGC